MVREARFAWDADEPLPPELTRPTWDLDDPEIDDPDVNPNRPRRRRTRKRRPVRQVEPPQDASS